MVAPAAEAPPWPMGVVTTGCGRKLDVAVTVLVRLEPRYCQSGVGWVRSVVPPPPPPVEVPEVEMKELLL